jgi:hypothetical protein
MNRQPLYHDAAIDSAPLPEQFDFITRGAADRKAMRAFWRGVLIGGVAVAALGYAMPAFAGSAAFFGGTGCSLIPVTGKPHVAEVLCLNVETAGPSMNEATITADGLDVHLTIIHGPGDDPDEFTITPPPGYTADPPVLILNEWTGGTVYIYQFLGA